MSHSHFNFDTAAAPLNNHWMQSAAAPLAEQTPPVARKTQSLALTDAAHIWLTKIPPRYQPLATARRHPHIVNRLAELWDFPAQLPTQLRELMLSTRPGRAGFAFEVLTELADLQLFMESDQQRQKI